MNLRTHYDTKHPDNPEINKKQMNEFANIEKGVSNDLRTKPSEHIEENYSLMILKNRLAKGEITIEEFNNLKKVLDTE